MNARHTGLIAGLLLTSLSFGQGFVANSDTITYDNVMETRYATLADATAGTNAVATYSLANFGDPGNPRMVNGVANEGGRDFSIYAVNNVASYDVNQAETLTGWYYTTTPANGAGWGNPNNTDTGFYQMYDSNASTVSSWSGAWSTLNLGVAGGSTFQFSLTGSGAGAAQYARLWAGMQGGASEITAANILSYSVNGSFSGLTANIDNVYGMIDSSNDPTGATGTLSVLAQNVSTTRPDLNGYYVMTASLGVDNWAVSNGAVYPAGGVNYTPYSLFGTSPVPEPNAAMFAPVGILGLLIARKRSKK